MINKSFAWDILHEVELSIQEKIRLINNEYQDSVLDLKTEKSQSELHALRTGLTEALKIVWQEQLKYEN